MDHIWQEMAEKMMAKDPSMFACDCAPEDVVAALQDAWGLDRVTSIWSTEDVLDRAREYFDTELSIEDARTILPQLTDSLDGGNSFDVLDDLIYELIGGSTPDDSDYSEDWR
jgi:hypothetical protein